MSEVQKLAYQIITQSNALNRMKYRFAIFTAEAYASNEKEHVQNLENELKKVNNEITEIGYHLAEIERKYDKANREYPI